LSPNFQTGTRIDGSMPVSGKRAKRFSFDEVTIAVGLAAGARTAEIAASLGITDRAVRYKVTGSKHLGELVDAIGPLLASSKREVKEIDPKNLDKELAGLTSQSVAALRATLESTSNPKDAATLALSVIKQVREQLSGGERPEDHRLYTLSEDTLRAFEDDVLIDRDLIARARALEVPSGAAN